MSTNKKQLHEFYVLDTKNGTKFCRWDVIQDGKYMRKDMDRLKAYEKALVTWGRWVSSNINFKKVQVFFQGISPDHSK